MWGHEGGIGEGTVAARNPPCHLGTFLCMRAHTHTPWALETVASYSAWPTTFFHEEGPWPLFLPCHNPEVIAGGVIASPQSFLGQAVESHASGCQMGQLHHCQLDKTRSY